MVSKSREKMYFIDILSVVSIVILSFVRFQLTLKHIVSIYFIFFLLTSEEVGGRKTPFIYSGPSNFTTHCGGSKVNTSYIISVLIECVILGSFTFLTCFS